MANRRPHYTFPYGAVIVQTDTANYVSHRIVFFRQPFAIHLATLPATEAIAQYLTSYERDHQATRARWIEGNNLVQDPFGTFHRPDHTRFSFFSSDPTHLPSMDPLYTTPTSLSGLLPGSQPIAAGEPLGFFGAVGDGRPSSSEELRVQSVVGNLAEGSTRRENGEKLDNGKNIAIAKPTDAPKSAVPRLVTVLKAKQNAPPRSNLPRPRQSYAAMAVSEAPNQEIARQGHNWPLVGESSAMGALRGNQTQLTSRPVMPAISEKVESKPETTSTELARSINTTTTLETSNHIVSESNPVFANVAQKLMQWRQDNNIQASIPRRPAFRPSRMATERPPVMEHGRTYLGDMVSQSYNKQTENLPSYQNCALFVRNLPRDVTVAQFLAAVDTGAVYAVHINPPNKDHWTSAAKLVFFKHYAAQHFLNKCKFPPRLAMGNVYLSTVWNSHGYAENQHPEQSRVLRISGPYELMAEMDWVKYAQACVACEFSHTKALRSRKPGHSAFEMGFARVDGQAESVYAAIVNEPNYHGIFRVEYARDPCDPDGVDFQNAVTARLERLRPKN